MKKLLIAFAVTLLFLACVTKEVVVEIIKEVPVEVEVIKEIPVEIIVEKEVFVDVVRQVEIQVPFEVEVVVTATPLPILTPNPQYDISDGIWLVGDKPDSRTIVPGTYETFNEDGECYWRRLSGFSEEYTDIIAHAVPGGHAIVTIKASDTGFSSRDCGKWVLLQE
jgi:hypothetical protein